MRKSEGSPNAPYIECINPRKGTWRVRFNVERKEDSATWLEHDFDHRPTTEEVRGVYVGYVNSVVDESILMGLTYEGHMVWLSAENQLNYKAAHDLAVQTNGTNLPIRFKLGTTDDPYYVNFTTVSDLTKFYSLLVWHVQQCIERGWQQKDSFDAAAYQIG